MEKRIFNNYVNIGGGGSFFKGSNLEKKWGERIINLRIYIINFYKYRYFGGILKNFGNILIS